ASGFALLCVELSARPPNPKFPYGYGKITYFSAGFEGGLIALAACAILYEAIQGLVLGEHLERLDIGLGIMALASAVNLALGVALVRVGRATRSLIVLADGRHILADAYTSSGVLLGVGLILLTGWGWLDSMVAILVGLYVLWTGYGLVREAVIGLMDRADPEMLARIVSALQAARQPGWIDLHQLRAWQAGEAIFVDFHLVVPENWTVAQVHDAHVRCREFLRSALGEATEIIIHFDPERRAATAHVEAREWTVESAVRVPGIGELGSEAVTPEPPIGSKTDAVAAH
ncbi:MAG TPA: cation diffusion facilitator family transporter, partial [Isosphaeraceae bacterium]|nr:cation diffusion facilitator family transporter [Isosphaeraceae bacterium]